MWRREGLNVVCPEACQTLWPLRESHGHFEPPECKTHTMRQNLQTIWLGASNFALFWTSLAAGLKCLSKTGLPSKWGRATQIAKKKECSFTASFCRISQTNKNRTVPLLSQNTSKTRCTPRGSCNNTLLRRVLRRVLRRFSNSKCFLEGFLEGASKGFSKDKVLRKVLRRGRFIEGA